MSDHKTVFIVDDNRRFLRSIEMLLQSHDLRTRGFNSAEEFLNEYQPENRGCLLLDVRLPKMSGLDLLEELRKRGWLIPTIMMTSYGTIPKAVRAIHLGAIDFLEKPFHKNANIISMIRDAMDAETTTYRVQHSVAETAQRLKTLKPREREVLELLVESYSNQEIADELQLSVRTVEHYRLNLMSKMGAKSLGDLIHKVVQHSLATQLNAVSDPIARSSDSQNGQ